jgi:hypothetical protein
MGGSVIRAEPAKWFADPGQFEQLHPLRTEDGGVVAYPLTRTEDGVARAADHAHLRTVEAGLIVADTVWCVGRRPEPLVADRTADGVADRA